ncbi:VOC family protein [Gordonia soli]|uniref:VOC domain-containing protein n=1 Tax=Gordonia soli NBRC 108243 TaxID=1223545 RepID=M0QNZ3_9ACTN|nr:VOC family protein [Gordonia soli]GAC70293.1 hypothetical protein GS4_33_01080 [Gordonia soli NBRC 108243]
MTTNHNHLMHFAINAADVAASKTFYQSVFDWEFSAWGPPGFYKIDTGGPVNGALQQSRPLAGRVVDGTEATFSVSDVDAVAESALRAGGQIVLPRHTIAGVGHLIFFTDPSGNTIGAMQQDPHAG